MTRKEMKELGDKARNYIYDETMLNKEKIVTLQDVCEKLNCTKNAARSVLCTMVANEEIDFIAGYRRKDLKKE